VRSGANPSLLTGCRMRTVLLGHRRPVVAGERRSNRHASRSYQLTRARHVPPVDPRTHRRRPPRRREGPPGKWRPPTVNSKVIPPRSAKAPGTGSSAREVGDRPDQRLRDGCGPGEDRLTGRTALSIGRVVVGIRPGHRVLIAHRPARCRDRATPGSFIEMPRVPRRSPFYPLAHGVSRSRDCPAVAPHQRESVTAVPGKIDRRPRA
jgi:hypothetical protein